MKTRLDIKNEIISLQEKTRARVKDNIAGMRGIVDEIKNNSNYTPERQCTLHRACWDALNSELYTVHEFGLNLLNNYKNIIDTQDVRLNEFEEQVNKYNIKDIRGLSIRYSRKEKLCLEEVLYDLICITRDTVNVLEEGYVKLMEVLSEHQLRERDLDYSVDPMIKVVTENVTVNMLKYINWDVPALVTLFEKYILTLLDWCRNLESSCLEIKYQGRKHILDLRLKCELFAIANPSCMPSMKFFKCD